MSSTFPSSTVNSCVFMKIGSLLCSDNFERTESSSSSCRSPSPIGLRTLALAATIAEPHFESTGMKVKPKRKRATPGQVAVLKIFYSRNPFPDTDCRQYLAEKLGMTPRSVQIWFQNQRQHDKAAGKLNGHESPT